MFLSWIISQALVLRLINEVTNYIPALYIAALQYLLKLSFAQVSTYLREMKCQKWNYVM